MRLKADITLFIISIIWGSAFVPQRVAGQMGSVYLFNGFRYLLAALVVLPVAFRSRQPADQNYLSRDQYKWMGVAGITAYGGTHPQLFRRIRRFLMHFAALEENAGLKNFADASLDALVVGFREWLGANQKIEVNLETSEEYNWEDVIAFEEGIDPDDRQRKKMQSPERVY